MLLNVLNSYTYEKKAFEIFYLGNNLFLYSNDTFLNAFKESKRNKLLFKFYGK